MRWITVRQWRRIVIQIAHALLEASRIKLSSEMPAVNSNGHT
jgi:hypothetical protein